MSCSRRPKTAVCLLLLTIAASFRQPCVGLRPSCHKNFFLEMSDDIVLKLKMMSRDYIRRKPFFRNHILHGIPGYRADLPNRIITSFNPNISSPCLSGPRVLPAPGRDITLFLPMMNYILPHVCIGVYVTQDWVLAPTHCLTQYGNERMFVASLGHISYTNHQAQMHFDKRNPSNSAIGVFKLKYPNEKRVSACAPDVWMDILPPKTRCVVTFASAIKLSSRDNISRYTLLHAFATIESYSSLLIFVKLVGIINKSTIDAAKTGELGPLLCQINGYFTIVGISSNPNKRKGNTIPFTRISQYVKWIRYALNFQQTIVRKVELIGPIH